MSNHSFLESRDLPPRWKWVKLRDVCSRIQTTDPRKTPDVQFTYIDISSIDRVTKTIYSPAVLLGKDAPSRARRVIRAGDVLVATTRPNLNAVALVGEELDGQVCSTGMCVLRPDCHILDSGYLYFATRAADFINSLSGLVQGAMYPAVTDHQVLDQTIPLPPLAEQKRIVAVLNEQLAAVERARKAAEERLEAAQALQGTLLEHTLNVAGFSDWPEIPLGDIGNIASGITLGRKVKYDIPAYPRPYLRVANVKDGYLDLDDVKDIPVSDEESQKYILEAGDLLLTEGGDPDKLGRGCVWNGEIPKCLHQNHIFRVRFEPSEINPRFMSYVIGSSYGKTYFLANARQTTGIATINRGILQAFPMRLPPIDQQNATVLKFDNVISANTRLIDAIRHSSETVEDIPNALLRRAFSGEI